MATRKIPTQKPVWLNDDETVANVIYEPIDIEATFTPESFLENFSQQETFRNANKAELSQLLFGDDRVESISDREFSSLQRNFNRDVVQEGFSTYVARQSPNLIHLLSAVDTEQTERHILGKNRQAETSVFRPGIPANATNDQRTTIKKYHGAADAVDEYHAEVAQIDESEDAYVATRLNNLTDSQLAVIKAATGSHPGDSSRIARSYKTFYAAKALEEVKKVGIPKYAVTNMMTARQLEYKHRTGLEAIEADTEARLIELGPGATRENVKPIYQRAEEKKEQLKTLTQNAGTDARYIFADLANKTNEAAKIYVAAQPQPETQ